MTMTIFLFGSGLLAAALSYGIFRKRHNDRHQRDKENQVRSRNIKQYEICASAVELLENNLTKELAKINAVYELRELTQAISTAERVYCEWLSDHWYLFCSLDIDRPAITGIENRVFQFKLPESLKR